jgi:ribose transport system substrate-binding protein
VVVLGAVVPAASAGAQPSQAATKHMAIVMAAVGQGGALQWMASGGVFAASDVGGITANVVGPSTIDGPKEVKMLQDAAATARDGIVIENLAPPLFTQLEAKLVAKGIPIVALDTAPMPGSNVNLYVGNDNYALGASLAEQVIKQLPANASGTIVVNDLIKGVPTFDLRVKGITDTFAKVLPRVKAIEVSVSCQSQDACYKAFAPVVRANSHALALLSTGTFESTAFAQLKKEQGGKYLIGGFDLNNQTLQDIKSGLVLCTVSNEHYLMGYIAMRFLAESAKTGKPLPKGWFDMPGLVVDKTLVDVIMSRQSSDTNTRAWLRPEIARIFANTSSFMKPLSTAR